MYIPVNIILRGCVYTKIRRLFCIFRPFWNGSYRGQYIAGVFNVPL